MGDNLKQTAVSGARWGFIENISSMGITFVVGIILARILSPEQYGLIGDLTIFIAISISLIDNGFSAAIIRKPEPTKEDLNTTFITNLGISIICFIVLFACAPLVSNFFNEPQLTLLLRVLSFILIVNAVSIIQRALIVKSVDFKRLTACTVTSSLLSGIVGIWMALTGCGVWSLVGQQVSKQVVNSIMLWLLGTWKPDWRFSKKSFKELFSYGSNVMITGLLDTIFKNIYYPVVGKSFSIGQLGQYTRADQFSNVTSNNLTMVVQRVSFPVLSKTQDSDERMLNAFRSTIKVTMLISFFIAFWLSAVSQPLVVGLIGMKWLPASYILQIICLAGAFFPIHALNQNILQIKGRMKLYLALEINKKILLAISIAIGIICCNVYDKEFGLKILLWGMVAVSIIVFFVNAYFSGKYLKYSVWRQTGDIIPSFFISLVVACIIGLITAGCVYLFRIKFGWHSLTLTNLVAVAIGSFTGLLIMAGIYAMFPRKEYDEVKNLIKIWKSAKLEK